MPVCKAEAHRALELLEDYYSRLDDVEERELKVAIERVIKIFKSRLFQALLDIQVLDQHRHYLFRQSELYFANNITLLNQFTTFMVTRPEIHICVNKLFKCQKLFKYQQ